MMVACFQKSRLGSALGLSLAIHFSIWFLPHSQSQRAPEVTYVEFQDRPPPAVVKDLRPRPNQQVGRAVPRALPGAGPTPGKKTLLLSKSHWDPASASTASGKVSLEGGAVSDSSDAPWGDGGGDFARTRDYLLLKRVEDHVQGLVAYPAVLAEHKISGVVNARLVVDGKGGCNWQKTSISSSRPELRVYVLAVLKKLCGFNFWHEMRIERASNNLDFSFNFDLYGKEERAPRVLGNVVLFDIPGKQSSATWKLGPLQGSLFFPVAALLNPQWITENWQRLVEKKDPLEEFRER